jgi:aryl-alcohol dehydrogenase-like predicted oxidoreductase
VTSESMPHRTLGGLSVSIVGLGCNNFSPQGRVGPAGTREVIDAALEAGINLFDTADIYGGMGGSETLIGEALRGRRDAVVLATKFGGDMSGAHPAPAAPRGSREYIRWAVEGSLRRLRTSVIDLYQYHRPDGVTPIADTLGALDELVAEGKVRYIGCSNVDAAAVAEAAQTAASAGLASFVSLQNEYSLLDRSLENDVLPECRRLGIGVLPYYPLANGLLTGKYHRGEAAPPDTRLAARGGMPDDRTFERLEGLADFSRERDLTMTEVAIGALAAQAQIASVIAGATRAEQVHSNARAARWTPSRADLDALDAIFPPGTSGG